MHTDSGPPRADRAEWDRARLDRATAALDPPFAVVDLASFDANATALARRAAGKPIRVASKSVRCRDLLARVLSQPAWRAVMAYTLAEALWLAGVGDRAGRGALSDDISGDINDDISDDIGGDISGDVLVAYPTADRAALARLATDETAARAVTIMIDDVAQLDLVDAVAPPGSRAAPIRVCLDLDASWRALRRWHVGVRRSPVRSPQQAGALAAQVAGRPGFTLVGLMAYEAQIAGVGDAGGGPRAAAVRAVQRRSYLDLLARRGAVVAAVREHAALEFVNGGGTGSITATASDPAVTEVTAGSGLYGPTLFDHYRAWRPQPAALFALPVVRRPAPGMVTVAGGGWIASGPGGRDRLPTPWLPAGLRLRDTEGAGEVQTPLLGPAADALAIGDRVWFRHAKAGELCEHVNVLHLVDGDEIVAVVPTYRGAGHAFA